MSDTEHKKLRDLRVIDLLTELEKRGLEKRGLKKDLVERLHKALENEGLDPETYVFDESDKKMAKALPVSSDADKIESESPDNENIEESDTNEEKIESVVKVKSITKDKPQSIDEKDNASQESSEIELTLDDKSVSINDVEDEVVNDDFPQEDADKDDVDDEKKQELAIQVEENGKEKEATSKKVEGKEATSNKVETGKEGTVKKVEKDKEATSKKVETEKEATFKVDNEDTKKGEVQDKLGGSSKPKKESKKNNPRAVWISNVTMNTRACEIRHALSPYGKVLGAKVVVNAKYPGTSCFGYVSMASVEDCDKVIENLNNTELNGRIVTIEKYDIAQTRNPEDARSAPEKPKTAKVDKLTNKTGGESSAEKAAPPVDKSSSVEDTSKEVIEQTEEKSKTEELADQVENTEGKTRSERDKKSKSKSVGPKSGTDSEHSRSKERSDRTAERSLSGGRRSRDRFRANQGRDVLTFSKIKQTHEMQRLRDKERELREEGRRRYEEKMRQKEIERKQRLEAIRLEREREQLRVERDRIEREKNELIKLERERQKLERERIEMERLELERTRRRLEEDRRAVKRPAPYSRDQSYEDRKRAPPSERFEPPPPPSLFDTAASSKGHSSNSSKKFPPKFSPKFPSKDYNKSTRDQPYKQDVPMKRPGEYIPERSSHIHSTISRPSASANVRPPYEDRERDARPRNAPSSSIRRSPPKDVRYDRGRDRSEHYSSAPIRDDRIRREIESKPHIPPLRPTDRYKQLPNAEQRFDRNSSGWTPSSKPSPFNSSNKWPKDLSNSWRPESSSERWNSNLSGSRNVSQGPNFTGSGINMTPCPPPPGLNNYPSRFDYKSMSTTIRKY